MIGNDKIFIAIKEWIEACPLLDGKSINIDYLENETPSYSIDTLPCIPIIEKYTDGEEIHQYYFALTSLLSYSSNEQSNLANIEFYEKFATWVESCNSKKEYPAFNNVRKIEIIEAGHLLEKDVDKAKYQIKMRVLFSKN